MILLTVDCTAQYEHRELGVYMSKAGPCIFPAVQGSASVRSACRVCTASMAVNFDTRVDVHDTLVKHKERAT